MGSHIRQRHCLRRKVLARPPHEAPRAFRYLPTLQHLNPAYKILSQLPRRGLARTKCQLPGTLYIRRKVENSMPVEVPRNPRSLGVLSRPYRISKVLHSLLCSASIPPTGPEN